MIERVAHNWWAMGIRGLLALAFGIIVIARSRTSIEMLWTAFAAYAFLDGVLSILTAILHRERPEPTWPLFVEGCIGVVVAAIAVFWPQAATLRLDLLFAFWALLTGITSLSAAVSLRHLVEGEWMFGMAGILSVIAGVIVLAGTISQFWAFATLIGVFSISVGCLKTVLGLSLRLKSRYIVDRPGLDEVSSQAHEEHVVMHEPKAG